MLIELGFEDRDDAFAMRRAEGECPATGGLEAIFSVSFRQIEQPEARAVTLLGVGSVFELPLNDGAGASADVLSPVQKPPRRPFHVFSMRTRHVLGQRRMLVLQVAAHVCGDAAAF